MWKIPESFSEGAVGSMVPYYTIMKLAEVGKAEEYILMVPFTPAKKENMIAWLAARCDEPNYGKLYWCLIFPKQNLVYESAANTIAHQPETEISKAFNIVRNRAGRGSFGEACWSFPSSSRLFTCSRSISQRRAAAFRSLNA